MGFRIIEKISEFIFFNAVVCISEFTLYCLIYNFSRIRCLLVSRGFQTIKLDYIPLSFFFHIFSSVCEYSRWIAQSPLQDHLEWKIKNAAWDQGTSWEKKTFPRFLQTIDIIQDSRKYLARNIFPEKNCKKHVAWKNLTRNVFPEKILQKCIEMQEPYKDCTILQNSCQKYVFRRILQDFGKNSIFVQLGRAQKILKTNLLALLHSQTVRAEKKHFFQLRLAIIYTYYKCEKFLCVCVCIIKLLCHFLPDLAQILNKAMNSKGAASKPVPGADFTQLLILRHLFVSHTQILADSQSDCEKVVEPKRNPNRTDFLEFNFLSSSGLKQGLIRYY